MLPVNTRQAVHVLADALLIEGIEPTTLLIRERLGRGSHTTITAALRDWRQARSGNADAAQRVLQVAQDGVPASLTDALHTLWLQALQTAHDTLTDERKALADERTALHAAMQQSAQRQAQLLSQWQQAEQREAQLRQALDAESRQRQDVELALAREQTAAAERLAAGQVTLDAARQALADSQHAAQQARIAHEEAIARLQDAHQQQLDRQFTRLDALRQQLLLDADRERDAMRRELAAARERETALAATHEQAATRWQQERDAYRKEAAQRQQALQQQLGQRDTDIGRLEERLAHSQQRLADCEQQLAHLRQARLAAETPPSDETICAELHKLLAAGPLPRPDLIALCCEECLCSAADAQAQLSRLLQAGELVAAQGQISRKPR